MDWSTPAVHLLNLTTRATFVPNARDAATPCTVAITRQLWVALAGVQGSAVCDATAALDGANAIEGANVGDVDGCCAAYAYRVLEIEWDARWRTALTDAYRELERSVIQALASIASVVASRLQHAASPRAVLLNQAFALTCECAGSSDEDRLAMAAVTRADVTRRLGVEGLPVFMRDAHSEQLDLGTLDAGHDARWSRRKLDALARAFAARSATRPGLRIANVPGELQNAIGIITSRPLATLTRDVRDTLEEHLDLMREVAGPPRVGRGVACGICHRAHVTRAALQPRRTIGLVVPLLRLRC